MLLSERLITLQAWLNNLPTEQFQKRPALLSLKGALLCAVGEGHLALSTLDRTILEFQKTDDLANLTLAFVRRSAAHRLVGDYASSLQDAEEALRLSENKPDLQFTYAEAERFKGISLYQLGADSRSNPVQEDALRCYEQLGDKQRAAWVLVELGNSYHASGNYQAALNAYNQALDEWRQEGNLPSVRVADPALEGDVGSRMSAGKGCGEVTHPEGLVTQLEWLEVTHQPPAKGERKTTVSPSRTSAVQGTIVSFTTARRMERSKENP